MYDPTNTSKHLIHWRKNWMGRKKHHLRRDTQFLPQWWWWRRRRSRRSRREKTPQDDDDHWWSSVCSLPVVRLNWWRWRRLLTCFVCCVCSKSYPKTPSLISEALKSSTLNRSIDSTGTIHLRFLENHYSSRDSDRWPLNNCVQTDLSRRSLHFLL